MRECIFCKIAAGDIPSHIVYEDDQVVAFDDLSPQGPIHSLVIPRDHFDGLGHDVPDDVLAALLAAVPKVAAIKGVADTGYRTIINTGPDAGQTIHHLHAHVIGGLHMAEGMIPKDRG